MRSSKSFEPRSRGIFGAKRYTPELNKPTVNSELFRPEHNRQRRKDDLPIDETVSALYVEPFYCSVDFRRCKNKQLFSVWRIARFERIGRMRVTFSILDSCLPKKHLGTRTHQSFIERSSKDYWPVRQNNQPCRTWTRPVVSYRY